MKRVVVINDFAIARGGATGIALFLVEKLRKFGVNVTYVCGDDGDNPELLRQNVEVVAAGASSLVKEKPYVAFTRGIYNGAARILLEDWIRRNDTRETIYHVHGWSKILSPSIFEALQPVAGRTVIHAHDFFLACPNGAFMNYQTGAACKLKPLSPGCMTTHCDKRSYPQKLWRATRQISLSRFLNKSLPWFMILPVHRKMADPLVSAGYMKAGIVPLINPAEPYGNERIKVELNSTLFFIGRIEAEKGILQALKAAKAADMPMSVIGDGPLRADLEREWPHVTFHGWCSRPQIVNIIQTARAVIMPSLYPEPFGLVSAESSLSGLPVLMSRHCLPAEDFTTNRLGLDFDVTDLSSVIQAVERMKNMAPEEIKDISVRGHQGVTGMTLSSDEWIGILLKLYSQSIEHYNNDYNRSSEKN